MKNSVLALSLALIVGFLAGLVLTEGIAVIGLTRADGTMWMRYLRYIPIYTGVAAALIVLVRIKRRR